MEESLKMQGIEEFWKWNDFLIHCAEMWENGRKWLVLGFLEKVWIFYGVMQAGWDFSGMADLVVLGDFGLHDRGWLRIRDGVFSKERYCCNMNTKEKNKIFLCNIWSWYNEFCMILCIYLIYRKEAYVC